MRKTIYQIMSAIVLFALTFGSYSSAGASSESAPQMAGTTYYVSATGNDANAGTSSSAPFKTIQKCVNVASSGNVCSVAAGIYAERLNINKAITVVCDKSKSCIIKGAVLAGNAILDGFYSLNSDTNDGALVANGSGNIIRNNKVEGSCMVGINLNGSANRAENNEILKSRQCAGSSNPDADGIRYFGANQVMRGNYIHDIVYDSTNTTAHIDCFQTWGGASGALIENNICDNYTANATLAGSGANIENDTGAIFRNNYFHTWGKKIMIESSSSNTVIENNIFIGGNLTSTLPSQYGLFGSGAGEMARNNVFYNINIANGTSVLYGVSNGGGNLLNTDPKVNGYCSTAYPLIGVPCGAVISPTSTPVSTATPLNLPTATFTPTQIAALPTPTASPVIASATPTASSVPASPTPTASSVPASPTPTASSVPASPTPTASSVPASPTPTASPVPVLPTSTTQPVVQPTSTPQEVNPLTSEKVFDDKDAGFVYSPNWQDVSNQKSYGGSYKLTTQNGSFATFTFTGQSFSILYKGGPAFRKIDVYVDGLLVGTINEKGKTSTFQKRWGYPGTLTAGSHALKLVFVTGSTSNNVSGSIDAVIVH